MSAPNWEDVDVPRGAYIGWGEYPGQHVTGKVLDFDPVAGTDFAGTVCTQLSVELIVPADFFNKQGERTDFAAGELVVLNCGQVSLKRAVKAADPKPGDLVKITLENLAKTANGTVKEMGIKIARGAGGPVNRPQPAAAPPAAAPATNPFGAPAAGPDPWANQPAAPAPAAAPAANPFGGQPAAQPPF